MPGRPVLQGRRDQLHHLPCCEPTGSFTQPDHLADPQNTYSSSGAGSCTTCPDGQYSSGGWSSCQSCSAGTYSTGGSGCLTCAAGTVSSNGAASCTACSPGYYSNNAANGCQACQAGTYTATSGQTSCTSCTPGYFQTYTAQTGCNICQCGTYQGNTGATTCQTCSSVNNQQATSPQGSTSQSQCTAIGAGYYTNSSGCAAQCPGGSYSTGGQTSCTSCSSNQVAPAGATASSQCSTCKTGTLPNASKTSCTATASGKRRRDQLPLPRCPPGHTACKTTKRGKTFYTCVDTKSDIEACGGCPGDAGVWEDCTAFDPLANASCVNGQCQYRCPSTHRLTPLGCVRTSMRHAGQKRVVAWMEESAFAPSPSW